MENNDKSNEKKIYTFNYDYERFHENLNEDVMPETNDFSFISEAFKPYDYTEIRRR